ncbi:MAG: excinuclease ABC subunit UvrA [Thermoguttaceae bacterium]|nr:excinuclease ABC subunit UvrA [Thermoguttaceae bacterium]
MDYPREENAWLENDAARPAVDAVETDKTGETGKSGEASAVFDPVHPPLRVVGARAHNLKNVDVDIPWNRLTALTGPSGSGKSSLAFDTIYAEGQRQYIESLSIYSRQFLHQLERPDVDSVSGLQPTIALDQRSSGPNPRSTVATVTEIYDFLRLLYARVGVVHCYRCGRPIRRQTVERMAEEILRLPPNTRFMLLAPIVRGKKGAHKDVFRRLVKTGFTRARVDGALIEIASAPELDPKKAHTIEAIVDRLILREGIETRLLESLKQALQLSEGLVCCLYEKERVTTAEGKTRSVWKDVLFSSLYSCPKCGVGYMELEPRAFSFNSPYGACPVCQGVGKVEAFDPDALVSNPELSLADGALALGKGLATGARRKVQALTAEFERIAPDAAAAPVETWDEKTRKLFFYGEEREETRTFLNAVASEIAADESDDKRENASENEPEKQEKDAISSRLLNPERESLILEEDRALLSLMSGAGSENKKKVETGNDGEPIEAGEENGDRSSVGEAASATDAEPFVGLIPTLEAVFATAKSKRERDYLATFRGEVVCPDCGGARVRLEARSTTVAGKKIHEATAATAAEALEWFQSLTFKPVEQEIAAPIVAQILERLDAMNRLGLDYLTLDRAADTLSGGELQRVRLTNGLGCGLSGVCYILDEPSTGLHPRDNEKLIEALRALCDRGNTVLVVEHDEAIMERADWLIDVGPGAGEFGGEILAQGTPAQVAAEAVSATGRYLSGKAKISAPEKRRKIVKTRSIVLEGATMNNLKNVTATFPLGVFTCVTGVSGSGKSSLLNETLVPALRRRLNGTGARSTHFKSLRGASRIDKLIQIDQSPIGRTPRSNPATYAGIFDEIRKVFANSRDAKRRGYKAGRFSFNVAGGRCEECQGQGIQKIEMHFLPDMRAVCPVCEGKRFNRQTLEARYKEKSIADVLDMSVDEAREFFANYPTIVRQLESFQQVGLGYLRLGQSSTTLSGGEAQRVKLATELARVETGNTLYVLDEPTCGLHAQDVEKLLEVLQRLVDAGNTVIVVEHCLDVMKAADWIIDMGPEGGVDGGEIVATGTPEEIAALENNETGRFLRVALAK